MKANCLFCYNLRVHQGYSGYGSKKVHVGYCSEKEQSIFKFERGCAYFKKMGQHDYHRDIERVKKLGDRILYVHQLMVEHAPDFYQEGT